MSVISLGLTGCLNKADIILFSKNSNNNTNNPTPPNVSPISCSSLAAADDITIPMPDQMAIADNTATTVESMQSPSNLIGDKYYIVYGNDFTSSFPPSLTKSTPATTEKNVIVISKYAPSNGFINLTLGDGDDIVYFDGASSRDYPPSLNLGEGNNVIVLRGAYLSNPQLGSGQSKIYLSPIKNDSIFNLDKTKHKIVLTNGLELNDLSFEDDGSNLIIKFVGKNAKESTPVNLITITKGVGGFDSIADLEDCSLFQIAKSVDKKHGTFYPTTKYPKHSLLKFTNTAIDYLAFNSVIGQSSSSYLDYNTSTPYTAKELHGKTISSNYFLPLASSPTPIVVDNNYVPLYQRAETATYDDYIGHHFPEESTLNDANTKYYSFDMDKRLFLKRTQSLGMKGYFRYNNPGRFVFYSQPYDHSDHYLYSSTPVHDQLLNVYFSLNGKEAGNIFNSSSQTYVHLFASREGTEAIMQLFPSRFKFYLEDNIQFSDLIFSEDADYVYIKINDDSNTDINIAIIRKLNGITLANVQNAGNFDDSGYEINAAWALPAYNVL